MTSHCIILYHIIACYMILYHILSYYMILYHIITHHLLCHNTYHNLYHNLYHMIHTVAISCYIKFGVCVCNTISRYIKNAEQVLHIQLRTHTFSLAHKNSTITSRTRKFGHHNSDIQTQTYKFGHV